MRMLSIPLAFVAFAIAGCGTKERAASSSPVLQGEKVAAAPVSGTGRECSLPHAIVYRTRGDYAALVPVCMSADRTMITSFPDPRDIRPAGCRPIALEGGYLLDRRGVGRNTVFLDYAFEEYAGLSHAPAPDTLKAHVIDFHPIIGLYVLPISAGEAWSDPSKANAYVRNSFAGCEAVVAENGKAD